MSAFLYHPIHVNYMFCSLQHFSRDMTGDTEVEPHDLRVDKKCLACMMQWRTASEGRQVTDGWTVLAPTQLVKYFASPRHSLFASTCHRHGSCLFEEILTYESIALQATRHAEDVSLHYLTERSINSASLIPSELGGPFYWHDSPSQIPSYSQRLVSHSVVRRRRSYSFGATLCCSCAPINYALRTMMQSYKFP